MVGKLLSSWMQVSGWVCRGQLIKQIQFEATKQSKADRTDPLLWDQI
jgi:hypothetical protein